MKFLILALTLASSLALAMPAPVNHQKMIKKQAVKKPAAKKQVEKNPVYKVSTQVSIDGVKTTNSIVVAQGQKGEARNEIQFRGGSFTEVVVNKISLEGKPAVQMDFVIGQVDAVGNKSVIATPKISANLGEKSSIMIGDKKLIVSAVATKVSR